MVFAFGETVTVVTRTLQLDGADKPVRDQFGNDVYAEADQDIDNCPVWPTGSTELVQAEDQVTTGLTVMLPASIDVTAIDAVIVRGDRYEIVGDPASYTSPFTGLNPGTEVRLTKTTG